MLRGKIYPKTCTICHRTCIICTWTGSVYSASNDSGGVATERGRRGAIFSVRGDSRWMGLARVLCASTVFDRWRLKSNIRLSAHQWTSIESQSRDTSSIGLKLVCLVHKGGQLTWLPLEGNTTCTPSIEVLPRHRETGPAR